MIRRLNFILIRLYLCLPVCLLMMLSVKALLSSVPTVTAPIAPSRGNCPRRPLSFRLAKEDKEESRKQKQPAGVFGFLFRGKKDDEDKTDYSEEASSTSFVRKIFETRRERKARSEARRQQELEAILEKEISKENVMPIGFDVSTLFSALEDVESGIKQTRDGLASVRTKNVDSAEEEKQLASLRKQKAMSRKDQKNDKQRPADEKATGQRWRKKGQDLKETEAIPREKPEADRVDAKDAKAADAMSASFPVKRSNPLSVAQKFVSNAFEKQRSKEEWIVVAPKTRISPGEIVAITAAGLDLLLVASKDGSSLHCIANSCPHLGTPLETGMLDRRPVELSNSSSQSSLADGFSRLEETEIASLLAQDGCEDCIVCPLHKTAFALRSGEVRGEWCPYPPVIGKVMGTVKDKETLPVFDVRTKGKNIEVRLNTPFKSDNR